jgi:hypothetical protein
MVGGFTHEVWHFVFSTNHPVRLRRPPLQGRGILNTLTPGPSPPLAGERRERERVEFPCTPDLRYIFAEMLDARFSSPGAKRP